LRVIDALSFIVRPILAAHTCGSRLQLSRMVKEYSDSIQSWQILTTIIVLHVIACYNVIELTFIIWTVFKQYSGIYFWSFVAATYGIGLNAIGALFVDTGPQGLTNNLIYATVALIGWVLMVNGQSMVLWSRLHLIMRDLVKLRLILYLIIANAIIFQTPSIILAYGATTKHWKIYHDIFEKIQVIVFFVQEAGISLVYIYETVQLSKVLSVMRNRTRSRQLRNHLIAINVCIIILDAGITALQFANQFSLQSAYKTFIYSVKLKMEFTILNRLVEMTTGHNDELTSSDWALSSRRGSCRQSTGVDACSAHFTQVPGLPRSAGAPSISFCCDWGHPVQPVPMAIRRPPSVAYEAWAYSRDDSECEMSRRNSEQGYSRHNNVLLTTEIVVKREKRLKPEDPGNSESSGMRSGTSPDEV
jgi:hypothetical protein